MGLVLLFVPYFQSNSGSVEARLLFDSMEARFEKAQTVRASFHLQLEFWSHCGTDKSGPTIRSYDCTLSLKRPDRARFDLVAEKSSYYISDGTHLRCIGSERGPIALPAGFREIVLALWLRGDIPFLYGVTQDWSRHNHRPKERFAVSRFSTGRDDRIGRIDARVIRYRTRWLFERTDEVMESETRLWLDPETDLPLRRIDEGPGMTATYQFDSVEIDPELDDRIFRREK